MVHSIERRSTIQRTKETNKKKKKKSDNNNSTQTVQKHKVFDVSCVLWLVDSMGMIHSAKQFQEKYGDDIEFLIHFMHS